jgi:hypothetical protein
MTDARGAVERARQAQDHVAGLADAERVAALEGIAADLESALSDDAD